MLVKRLTLAAGVETAFEFDEYAAKSVVVKNETAGEIQFCDGPFNAAKAAHIPAFSWQAFDVKVHYDSKPAFYVKAVVAGNVEIDFGSQGVGGTSGASVTQLSGSNTRKWATDTITFGAGAGAHNAGEIMSTDTGEILEFDVSAWIAAGGSGIILSSLVTLDQAPFANQAGYTLHLFTAAPTVIADNAAWVLVAAELATYIGKLDISSMVTGTNASAALDIGHNLDFTLASGSTKLYGQLVCKGTDTTVSTKIMTVKLGIAAL